MKSDKGFTFTEVLVSLVVLVIIGTALIPLTSFVAQERKTLSHKRIISYKLHDELQDILQEDFVPLTWNEKIEAVEVIFLFTETEEQYIKGCAIWNNLMNRQEEVCLYGLSER